MQPVRCLRIFPAQPVKQPAAALLLRIGFQPASQIRVFFHAAEFVIFQQGLDVQARTAHQYGKIPPQRDLTDQFRSLLLEICHAVRSVRRQDIDQMMGHRTQLFFRRFCCAYIHLPVNQHAVTGNNLPMKPFGKRDPAMAFTGRRRSQDHNYSFFWQCRFPLFTVSFVSRTGPRCISSLQTQCSRIPAKSPRCAP